MLGTEYICILQMYLSLCVYLLSLNRQHHLFKNFHVVIFQDNVWLFKHYLNIGCCNNKDNCRWELAGNSHNTTINYIGVWMACVGFVCIMALPITLYVDNEWQSFLIFSLKINSSKSQGNCGVPTSQWRKKMTSI